jgi:hypothetical protein
VARGLPKMMISWIVPVCSDGSCGTKVTRWAEPVERHRGDVLAADDDAAGSGFGDPGKQGEEARLAGAGWPGQASDLARTMTCSSRA